MTFIVEKPKTHKGYSYVIKTSWLQDAMKAHQLSTSTHLIYRTPKINDGFTWLLIEAFYWLPNPRVTYSRFYIRVGIVPINLKQQVASIIQTTVLPNLIEWMMQQENLDAQSTNYKTEFRATLKDGTLIIS